MRANRRLTELWSHDWLRNRPVLGAAFLTCFVVIQAFREGHGWRGALLAAVLGYAAAYGALWFQMNFEEGGAAQILALFGGLLVLGVAAMFVFHLLLPMVSPA